MAMSSNKVQTIAANIALFALSAGLAALAVMRIASHYVEAGVTTLTEAGMGFNGMMSNVAARPFDIMWANTTVLGSGMVTIAAIAIIGLVASANRQKLDNEETGKEHGNDRLARPEEMRALCDKKHYCNNIILSRRTRLAMLPWDKRTKKILDGRNLNCITLGISGLGKTFNMVWPDLMQSVGEGLEPKPYGVRNVPVHLKSTKAAKLAGWLGSVITGKAFAKDEGLAEPEKPVEGEEGKPESEAPEKAPEPVSTPVAERQAKPESAKEEPDTGAPDSTGAVVAEYEERAVDEASPADDPATEGARDAAPHKSPGRKSRMEMLRESYQSNVGSGSSQRAKRAASEKKATGGYDVFCTDPKGENVLDIGPMYERAGVKVKVLDTRNFKNGLHYNPLAYIRTRTTDVKAASDIACEITAHGPASDAEDAEHVEKGFGGPLKNGELRKTPYERGDLWTASAKLELETRSEKPGDVPETDLTADEIVERIKDEGTSDSEREILKKQYDLIWRRKETGAYIKKGEGNRAAGEPEARAAGSGCKKVASTVESFEYKKSSGTLTLTYQNLGAFTQKGCEVIVKLDPALVVDYIAGGTCGPVEFERDENGVELNRGTFKWKVYAPARPRRQFAGAARADHVEEKLVLHVHIESCTVPDGVDLTKTVDCLCANLRGTDAASNGSQDPFWEDTKRLCFMALVAFLFERYKPEERTLPNVMVLLNMALAKSGDPTDPSPLSKLMEMWETGMMETEEEPSGGGSRYKTGGTTRKQAGNVPRSRDESLALHCYYAFTSGAPETVQSVIITCQACLVNLITEEAKDFLAYDELELDTLGEEGHHQVIFCVTEDTNSPFDFITALVVYQAISLAQDRAYSKHGGKLPRHVRFVLDEAANIGKIPILVRALAVVRSRNISISLYLQSKAQLAMVYGEKEAESIFDNCTTIAFLGAQSKDTLVEMSERVGKKTVQSRMFQRSFSGTTPLSNSTSESISSNEKAVKSPSEMSRMEKGWLMLFVFNSFPIFDHKYETFKHPYYAYINPKADRPLLCAPCECSERFDYKEYRDREERDEEMD